MSKKGWIVYTIAAFIIVSLNVVAAVMNFIAGRYLPGASSLISAACLVVIYIGLVLQWNLVTEYKILVSRRWTR